jgi:hypothetical protein
MSSTGPGSLLVFLAFLMLSMLLAGTYFVAYLGLAQAGREVQKAGEAASEQAIVYLFQHPTNITAANGSVAVKGETRIVVQNVGSRDISFDRILAISPDGSVVADVKVPGNKGLGVRQWQLYKVQDLGLPERWSNFTVFSSEVSRLVLLSERGRTHGSIWGVPPFLEGVLRATVATTMTTSYFYSYITTTSYRTTHTVTVQLRQSGYSLMGEWWESDDGKNWRKVTSSWGRRAQEDCRYWRDTCWAPESGTVDCGQLYECSRLTGGSSPLNPDRPVITYHRYNETLTLRASQGYTLEGRSRTCDRDWATGHCVIRYAEWGKTYKLQAIEMVDWDTGEVYASVNQTSITFNIVRNTIARYKYVLTSSWSRVWIVILEPPPPEPERCQQILNDPSKRGSREWCACAWTYDPDSAEKHCNVKSCLEVSVSPCCTGDITSSACLDSWSGSDGSQCVDFTEKEIKEKITKRIGPVSWSASWSLKSGWTLADIGKWGPADCSPDSISGNSASGTCSINAEPNRPYRVIIIVIFKRT